MGRTSSPARRRGSSAGKASRSTPKSKSETPSPWNDDAPTSPNAGNHYSDLSESLRKKLLKYELTGKGFDLRLKDIVTPDTLKMQMTGELYAALQGKLEEIVNYTSLDFMRVLLKSANLPMSTRLEVAKEMLPYEHPRNPTPPPRDGEYRAALVIPGILSVEDWEREAAKQRERIKRMEDEK